jgi:hypothetical protein
MAGFASVVEHEGVLLRSADVNGFTVGELRFPAGYVQAPFEPDLPTWPSSSAEPSRSPSAEACRSAKGWR